MSLGQGGTGLGPAGGSRRREGVRENWVWVTGAPTPAAPDIAGHSAGTIKTTGLQRIRLI